MSSSLVSLGSGPALACSLSAKELLKALPPSAYTTARSARRGRALLAWPAHVSRTVASAEALRPPGAAFSPSFAAASMSVCAASSLRSAAASMASDEYRLTQSFVWDVPGALAALARAGLAVPPQSPPPLLVTHVAPLPPRRAPPIVVALLGSPRADASTKSSAWVAARAPLEAAAGVGGEVEEALLCDADGAVLEGTQTNLFVLCADGVLRTADAGVLAGTVRGLVLELLARGGTGLPRLELRAPRREGITAPEAAGGEAWRAAFLTSTSRLVLPIDEVRWSGGGGGGGGSGGGGSRRLDGAAPAVARIEELLAAHVDESSTTLVGEE